MLKAKLCALDHPTPETVNCEDPKQFRSTVLWLEDQKIRHYKIEDRAELRKIDSNEWDAAYAKYKVDLKVPAGLGSPIEELAWIMGYAVRLEYFDNVEKYRGVNAEMALEEAKPKAPSIKSTNPFDKLDFTSKEFEAGVRTLAKRLQIPYHPDTMTTLAAVAKVVQDNLSTEALKEPLLDNAPFPLEQTPGVGFQDADLEQAARILRLLQIQSVRHLQTTINETIVAVQNLTADPRTDTKLGKVGR
ncbi:RNA transcription, translation and transport factor protein [Lutzomyia longipalpis]|uniref:RNA transcription, translation and transport factor protein n=1 Tax=Lutzomyia longipalpis TaxID=7200 RepID=UPI00248439D5|nr:RNA transcription, translation and transport factor protein [Lutzomyia longipalpis]